MHLLQPSKEEDRTLKGVASKEETRSQFNGPQSSKEEDRSSKGEPSKEEVANSQHSLKGDVAKRPPKGEPSKGEIPYGMQGGRAPMQGDWEGDSEQARAQRALNTALSDRADREEIEILDRKVQRLASALDLARQNINAMESPLVTLNDQTGRQRDALAATLDRITRSEPTDELTQLRSSAVESMQAHDS